MTPCLRRPDRPVPRRGILRLSAALLATLAGAAPARAVPSPGVPVRTTPAHAVAPPLLVPARDVTVDYTVTTQNGAAFEVRVEIRAGGEKLRITPESLPTTFLVDRRAETAAILLPVLRAYTSVDIARYDPERTLLRGAAFTRAGRATMAGRACTKWLARSNEGEATACITDDGVIMQGHAVSTRRGALGSVQARRLAYGAPPGNAFEVPPDYRPSPVRLDALGFRP